MISRLKNIAAKNNHLKGFLIAALGAIFFSTKAIFVKLAFKHTAVDAITLLALRMLFSLPFYIVIAIISSKQKEKRVALKEWGYIILLGMVGYYLSSLFDFIGLKYISAGLERLILFLYPTFAILINTWLFKVKLTRNQVFALVLSYMGIAIAYGGELHISFSDPGFHYGSLMVFLCAVTYSFYLVGTGKIVPKVGATRFTAYTMLSATVGILAHFFVTHSVSIFSTFHPNIIYYCLALSIIATVLPSFMLSYGMKTIGSNNVAVITSIGPVSTILQAYLFLGETFHFTQVVGTILVIVGVLRIGKTENVEPEILPEENVIPPETA